MLPRFDRRVLSDEALEFVRACQASTPCHLAGGVALAGAFLAHRVSHDLDLFVHDRAVHRHLVEELPGIADRLGSELHVLRDSGSHVRATLDLGGSALEVDVVYEPVSDLAAPCALEGVTLESFEDLRANKLTCLLSRAEPRDLVDVLFLDRAGHRPEDDLPSALKKDAGIDPSTLAWLLATFPTRPMPMMIVRLSEAEVDAFRVELAARLKALAVPGGASRI